MPTRTAGREPDDRSGSQSPDDQPPVEPAHLDAIARTRMRTGGHIATHPTLLRVLEWLGWNNPGGGINP